MAAKLITKPTRTQQPSLNEKKNTENNHFLLRTVPLYSLLLTILLFIVAAVVYFSWFDHNPSKESSNNCPEQSEARVNVMRDKENGLIHPLLFVEIESEKILQPIKAKLNQYIEEKTKAGVLLSASVYLKDLNKGVYIAINQDSLYDPASLMKVPLLLIYYKEAETNPGILKKSYLFKRDSQNTTEETIKDKSLIEGQNYTVDELLFYMIAYSDNEAFWILYDHIDNTKFSEFDKTLAIPNRIDRIHFPASDKHYISNVNSVAHYFNVIYNASYLNTHFSTAAMNLLTKSTYKNGLLKGIDPDIIVAHKFGERTLSYLLDGRLENLQTEFHEFGIVYLANRPYLLGVMTRGNHSDQLQAVVGDISRIVYDDLKANK